MMIKDARQLVKSIPLWTSASLCFEVENSQQEQSRSSKNKRCAALIAAAQESRLSM